MVKNLKSYNKSILSFFIVLSIVFLSFQLTIVNAQSTQVWRYEDNIDSVYSGTQGVTIDISKRSGVDILNSTFYGSTEYTIPDENINKSYLVGYSALSGSTGNQKILSAHVTLSQGTGMYKIEFYNPYTDSINDSNATFEITDNNDQIINKSGISTVDSGWVTIADKVELGDTTVISGIGKTDNTNIRYDSLRFTKLVENNGPEAKDINYTGKYIAAEGIESLATQAEVGVQYTYYHKDGIAENTEKTQYQWYVSSNGKDGFMPINGATDKIFNVLDCFKGKYIKVGIITYDINGNAGEENFSKCLQVKFELVFDDEFNYTAVDGYDKNITKNWIVSSQQRITGGIKTARIPENVKVEDGLLKIITRKEHLDKYTFEHDWTTGSINTRNTFGPFGYYEARYKYTEATGLNQSFWIMGGDNSYTDDPDKPIFCEYDINEGHYPNQITSDIHYYLKANSKSSFHREYAPIGTHNVYDITKPNLADDFNVYAGYIRPYDSAYEFNASENSDTFQTFFNNKKYRSTAGAPTNNVGKQKMLASVAVLPGFAGPLYTEDTGDINKPCPDGKEMLFDYVRYYQPIELSNIPLIYINITKNDGNVVTIESSTNINTLFICASYDGDGKIEDIYLNKNQQLYPGENSLTLKESFNGKKVKVFVFDDFKNLNSLCKSTVNNQLDIE